LVAAAALADAEEVPSAVQKQLDDMRRIIEEQQRRIEQLESQLGAPAAPATPPTPAVVEAPPAETPAVETPVVAAAPAVETPVSDRGLEVGYDKGFFLRPRDPEAIPFSVRLNGRMQLRYTYFNRDRDTWTDNAGVTRTVSRRNDVEIERGRLEFSGIMLDPRLGYYLNIDGDTDDNHRAVFHDFWVSYAFARAFVLYGGKAFVPGSRDWLNGSTRTRFADRSLATTFFRPDRSLGLWAIGEPLDGVFYRTMLGNGFNTSDLAPDEIDDQFATATSIWWDVHDDYGAGASDLERHERPAAVVGNSFTFAPSKGEDASGDPLGEENFLRMSDGTQLDDEGALAPGVTVDRFDVYLYTVDAALKWRGFSVNGEYFFRWVKDIGSASGSLPKDDMFDHGFYLEGGYFVVPHHVELNARTSQIFGDFGDAAEYAGGINWFVNGTHGFKLTLDLTDVVRSPANNSGPNYRAGDDGLLLRTQVQTAF
jgi:hypothetical protein